MAWRDDNWRSPAVLKVESLDPPREHIRFCSIETKIVGRRHYNGKREIGPVYLQREPKNPFDYDAIEVYNGSHELMGHIPRDQANMLSRVIDGKFVFVGGEIRPEFFFNTYEQTVLLHCYTYSVNFEVASQVFELHRRIFPNMTMLNRPPINFTLKSFEAVKVEVKEETPGLADAAIDGPCTGPREEPTRRRRDLLIKDEPVEDRKAVGVSCDAAVKRERSAGTSSKRMRRKKEQEAGKGTLSEARRVKRRAVKVKDEPID